jgi:hypothetical protein
MGGVNRTGSTLKALVRKHVNHPGIGSKVRTHQSRLQIRYFLRLLWITPSGPKVQDDEGHFSQGKGVCLMSKMGSGGNDPMGAMVFLEQAGAGGSEKGYVFRLKSEK